MIPKNLIIERNYNGPPNSGNGGYSCGILGQYIDGPAEVRLSVPPPLDKSLRVEKEEDTLYLKDGDTLVATAKPTSLSASLPAPVSYAAAEAASAKYIGFEGHHFHTCFVCGPSREPADGLRIFAGATGQESVVAAPWLPHDALFDESQRLKKVFYWAAMDCPSYFALVGERMSVLLLGKMACHIENEIRQGERIVVMAWKERIEGRKHYSGTVLYGEQGELKSYSQNLWIALSEAQAAKIGAV